MTSYEHAGCRLERLPTGDWAVRFPDGLIGFHATEALARRAADRWRVARRRVDAVSPGGAIDPPKPAAKPDDG
jgi:hypothetical protein